MKERLIMKEQKFLTSGYKAAFLLLFYDQHSRLICSISQNLYFNQHKGSVKVTIHNQSVKNNRQR